MQQLLKTAIAALVAAYAVHLYYAYTHVPQYDAATLAAAISAVDAAEDLDVPAPNKREVDTGHLLYHQQEYPFGMVSDLDIKSRDPHDFAWRSYFKKGVLKRVGHEHFEIEWGPELPLTTHTAMKNRSMELSELVEYRQRLFGLCDITGLVFKIDPVNGRVFQRYAMADGNGDEPKPFKTEWATVKDGMLWLGSTGKEWTVDGRIVQENAQWVKTIDRHGRISNVNWKPVYNALRYAVNASFPGYLWHEAIHWDPRDRVWVILPRKATINVPYDPVTDELKGTNFLLVANEDFSDISVRYLGDLEPQYGFSAVRKVPGSNGIYMALKVKEVGTETHTKLVVFDLAGKMYLQPEPWVSVGTHKYEGLEFL